MKKLLSLALLSACSSSLYRDVTTKATRGTSEQQVTAALGAPQAYQTNPDDHGGLMARYVRGSETCVIYYDDSSKVKLYDCHDSSPQRSTAQVIGTIFQGMSDGMKSSQPTNCHTVVNGNYATTNCN